jgi:hypothetical protein
MPFELFPARLLRTVMLPVALGATLAIAPVAAQAPQKVPVVEVTQPLLDKWLVLYGEVAPAIAKEAQPTEAKVSAIYDKACRKAGFADIAQCRTLDDYMVALLGGAQEDQGTFIDPSVKARKDLALLNADRRIAPKQKAEERAEIERFIASLPAKIPEAHIALLNQNAKKVFQVLAAGSPPPPQQPPGPPGKPPVR